ncbi:major facilitator superfamily domain-containing protein [Neurospora hispaniola]|uniref:Major facilitator superfamily domain-containing protein n=1 Tax=Neurospora hispaniola TaxID=588809 RepID=A0AAJ0IGG3_9PEZI|nr:major facilitator superfamily domain-containing protein [Neurospora hispaniola]
MTGKITGPGSGDRVLAAPGSSRHVHDETTPLLSESPLEANKPTNEAVRHGDDADIFDDGETTVVADDYSPGDGEISVVANDYSTGDGEITVVADELSTTRLVVIFGTTWVGVFLGAIDASIIATLSAPIASEFQSLSLLSWIATAYLIANAACQPLSGRMTDIFGRGPGLVFSNVLFSLGNLICGVAKDEQTMILGRVVAGIGGGGLMSISTFLGSDLVPLRKRGVVQGLGNIFYGAGAMLGGVFGGFLNDTSSWGWRLAFLVQVPVSLVSAVLVYFLVKVPPKVSNKSLVSRIDFLGSFYIIAFLILLLLGLNAGGNVVPWTHPLVLISIPLSLNMLAGFIYWESRPRNTQPVIPVRLLTHRTVLTACVTNFMCTMVTLLLTFYIPIYLIVLGHTPTQAGLRLLASPLAICFTSFGSGLVMKYTGKYKILGIALVSTLVLGVAALTTLGQNSPGWIVFVALFMIGGGYGGMLTVTMVACIAAVDHSQQAVITSATYAFRSVGATVGITVGSAVYQNILKTELWARFGDWPGAAEEIGRIRDDLGELNRLPLAWREGVMESFMTAFRGVWFTALGMAAVGLVAVSLMRQHKLHLTLTRQED